MEKAERGGPMRQRLVVFSSIITIIAIRSGNAEMRNKAKSTSTTVRAETGELLPFPHAEKTLPNGLKVIVVQTGFPGIVSLQIPVQTGSRNEVEPGKSGFAHFFEHMMFRGTERYPPATYQAVLTRAGARQNAYTTDDYTNYHVTFAKEDLETILEIESDRFRNLSYSEEAFKTEARAVLGEYNKNSAEPLYKLIEVQRDHAFTTHTYKHTTMGFLKDIEDMPRQFEYSRKFFERWYRPEYTTIIVAGDFEPDKVFGLVEKHWGDWRRGDYQAQVPQESEPTGPIYAHVPWATPTLPWVTVAFRGPAFSVRAKDYAALDLLMDLTFGSTSEIYRRLVEQEQIVDTMFPYYPGNTDPYLATIGTRVKKVENCLAVRDAILKAAAEARVRPVAAERVDDAKSNARYGLLRTMDNTEAIAATLARFVRYQRSYDTLNALYRVYEALTPQDLQATARRYLTDERLVVTTLSHEALPEAMRQSPRLGQLAPSSEASSDLELIVRRSILPLINVKLLFTVGSAHDPIAKEGLAALAASMITEAGSKRHTIDEIKRSLYPMAGSFTAQVDKEMTTFTGVVHRDNWERFADLVLPMLVDPGFREEDFQRLKDAQLNALVQDLRANNEEELGKERLQAELFAGTPYGHPVLGTVAGIESITREDVLQYTARAFTRANLTVGLTGDLPESLIPRLTRELAVLPAGPALPPPAGVVARRPRGIEVDIVAKETRATAISLGHPIDVTRSHPDFPALLLARTWLGEHRSSVSHLYDRIREARGMNYGDYAYIEAFPRGMFQLFPNPNLGRRAQVFEIWIRPVLPQNAQMALRIATYELRMLIEHGLTPEQFEATRRYLSKSVFILTSTQDQQIGYALDSDWYGIGEYATFIREKLAALTLEDVNRAVRRHLSAENLLVICVTKDAAGLRDALVSDDFSTIVYDAPKPLELLDEDKLIGALKLDIRDDAVRITPIEDVFAR
jgi:zinc protease